jgi:hypothetical protein
MLKFPLQRVDHHLLGGRDIRHAPDHGRSAFLYNAPMPMTLLIALIILVPVSVLLAVSAGSLLRERSVPSSLQFVGAVCLLVVIVVHMCEALHLFPSMHWGEEHSIGHYLDLVSAVLGITLLPTGYVLRVLHKRTIFNPPKKS